MAVTGHLQVGVTGGIGSGKSTVCDLFARHGRTIVSADLIARDVSEHDERVREEIKKAFGDQIYAPDRSLRRRELAAIVFHDPDARKRLNAIIHPRVFERIDANVAALSPEQRSPFLLIEAALMYEAGMDKRLGYVIVVDAPVDTRVARIMARGMSREDVLLRMESQLPAEVKIDRADFVIDNSTTREDLVPRIGFLNTLLAHMSPRR